MNERAELWLLIGGAIAATYIWRLIGTLLAQKIDPNSNLFQWFTCVAYAMIAGLISRMLWLPVGPLAETALWIRLTGAAIGLAVFFLVGRRVLLSVGAGLGAFIMLISISLP